MGADNLTRLASGLLVPSAKLNKLSRWGVGNECCGEEDCVIFSDDFDRDNSSVIGNGWNEVAGDWAIDNDGLPKGALTVEGAYSTCLGGGNNAIPLVIDVAMMMFGVATPRLLIGYINQDNHYFLELQNVQPWGTSDAIRLGQRVNGVDNVIAEVDVPLDSELWYGLRVCILSDRIRVNNIPLGVVGSSFYGIPSFQTLSILAEPQTGQVGLGTGDNNNRVKFNWFTIQQHRQTMEECPECVGCTACKDKVYPPELTITVSGMVDTPWTFDFYGSRHCRLCDEVNGSYTLPQKLLCSGGTGGYYTIYYDFIDPLAFCDRADQPPPYDRTRANLTIRFLEGEGAREVGISLRSFYSVLGMLLEDDIKFYLREDNIDEPFDCTTFSDLLIPMISGAAFCTDGPEVRLST